MLDVKIDFIVKDIDSKMRNMVASRREIILEKLQIFYLDADTEGMYRVYEGTYRLGKGDICDGKGYSGGDIRSEMLHRDSDLAWGLNWDVYERFSVGDQVRVRILSV